MRLRISAPALIGPALLAGAAAHATPEQDLNRAYQNFQNGLFLQARDGARDYLRARGPRFSAAFIVAASECMLHPHQAANAVPFQQLRLDYYLTPSKDHEINSWIGQCTSPPPKPQQGGAGVSVQGLTMGPPMSTGAPANNEPQSRLPSSAIPHSVIVTHPTPPVAAILPPDRCVAGFVWREAFAGDHVCVVPATRAEAAEDNRLAPTRRDPQGPYGPNTCIQGYVWREARPGDVVCVTPDRRQQAAADNAEAEVHRAR